VTLQTEIKSKVCKSENHERCAGQWTGLGIEVSCECECHTENNGQVDQATKLIDQTVLEANQNAKAIQHSK
jgi:hypothetical protein